MSRSVWHSFEMFLDNTRRVCQFSFISRNNVQRKQSNMQSHIIVAIYLLLSIACYYWTVLVQNNKEKMCSLFQMTKMRVDHRRCSVLVCLWSTERRCETGTDTCVLKWQLPLHDNFSPPKTRVCDSLTFDSMSYSCKFFSIFFTCSKHGPLWDFNYLAHVSIAQHSYCEFVTLFLFSCSFVSFKLPVASKRKANNSIFSLPC